MLFNSMAYAVFLPIVFTIYWTIPQKYRWALLLAASYYFYMSWNPKYVVLILFTTVISYCAGRLLEKESSTKKKKWIVAGTCILCLGVLFFFKYFNFFSETVTDILKLFTIQLNPITLNVLLPVGISFYTFQTLSYVVDVYKGDIPAEHHFGYYATFISFFPQLVAGPIERTRNLLPQIKAKHIFDYDQAIYGARLILWGLFKKIAIADVAGYYVDMAYDNLQSCTSFDMCMTIAFFTVQIYCDFSGYSDIAIGTAKLLGINLMTNFKSPYFATSVKEFWSLWHISLSTWFRDYLYIPLGGNRCGKFRNILNIMITFLLSGLWHGANWTFVLWGGIHGLAQAIEKQLPTRKLKSSKLGMFVSWLIVFAFVNIAWVFFRADKLEDAIFVISKAFSGITNLRSYFQTGLGFGKIRFLFVGIEILIVAGFDYLSLKDDVILKVAKTGTILRLAIEYALLFCIVIGLYKSTGTNQFVYFQF